MPATNVQWEETFPFFFSFFVGCIVYTAQKACSSPARYIFSVTNYFDDLRCSLMIVTITARTCKM